MFFSLKTTCLFSQTSVFKLTIFVKICQDIVYIWYYLFDFSTSMCKEYLRKMCILVLNTTLTVKYIALAIDPFLDPCYRSLLGVMCDVISDAAAEEEEEAIDVAHDTKKASIARAQEGINSSFAFAFDLASSAVGDQ